MKTSREGMGKAIIGKGVDHWILDRSQVIR